MIKRLATTLAERVLHRGDRTPEPQGLFAPDAIEVFPRRVRVGETWCETLAVTGYPREVAPGWLAPLLSYPGSIEVALHVEPIPNASAALHLRRQLARFESTRRIHAKAAALVDHDLEAAAADAEALARALARGEERLHRVGLYLTLRAPTEEQLADEIHQVTTLAASMLLDLRPVTFRALEGWLTTLPLGVDAIRLRRTFDTTALATTFPFSSSEIEGTGGILYGRNLDTGSLIFVDRFDRAGGLDNPHQVVLARSGAGKSFFAKLQVIRSLIAGIEVLVVDPENEYERLAEELGGAVVSLGSGGVRLNPLEVLSAGQKGAVGEQAQFVQTLVGTLVGTLGADERVTLDHALAAAYAAAGITDEDPLTHSRPAPLFADVVAHLEADQAGATLGRRLSPYVSGSYRGLLDAPTTVRPEGHLVVFSLGKLTEELKLPGTLLALHAIWHTLTRATPRPRIVVVDEAWLLLRSTHSYGVEFMGRLAKLGRKHFCGLVTITQDATDMLASDLGQAVITNSSQHVLLGQSPQAIEALQRAFNLSEGECSALLAAEAGQGIVGVGNRRAAFEAIADADFEYRLATSDPAELAAESRGGR